MPKENNDTLDAGQDTISPISDAPAPTKKLTAKKDFTILQGDFRLDIKRGDNISKVPKKYLQNLKTENVI